MKKRLLFIPIIVLLAYGTLQGVWFFQNERFALSFVKASLPEGRHTTPTPSVDTILEQPFTYLGHGSQVFVFESADKKYVLKLINFKRFRVPEWLQSLPMPAFQKALLNHKLSCKKQKQQLLFQSLKIAQTTLQKESGLIYTHLTQTKHLKTPICIQDKLQRSYQLNPNQTAFCIQRKATPLYDYLASCIAEGRIEEAKEGLDSLVGLLVVRAQRGIADNDPFLAKNAGFIGNDPIFLDLGQFERSPALRSSRAYAPMIRHTTRHLHAWLTLHSPSLASHLSAALKQLK